MKYLVIILVIHSYVAFSKLSKLKEIHFFFIISVGQEFRSSWPVVLTRVPNKAAFRRMLGPTHLKAGLGQQNRLPNWLTHMMAS